MHQRWCRNYSTAQLIFHLSKNCWPATPARGGIVRARKLPRSSWFNIPWNSLGIRDCRPHPCVDATKIPAITHLTVDPGSCPSSSITRESTTRSGWHTTIYYERRLSFQSVSFPPRPVPHSPLFCLIIFIAPLAILSLSCCALDGQQQDIEKGARLNERGEPAELYNFLSAECAFFASIQMSMLRESYIRRRQLQREQLSRLIPPTSLHATFSPVLLSSKIPASSSSLSIYLSLHHRKLSHPLTHHGNPPNQVEEIQWPGQDLGDGAQGYRSDTLAGPTFQWEPQPDCEGFA